MTGLEIYCVDIGSVAKERFGWFSSMDEAVTDHHRDIRVLVERVSASLRRSVPVALGFECPLYVPFALEPEGLTRSRDGESNRSWSAGAGCGALATGLVQTLWVLSELRKTAPADVQAYLDWSAFTSRGAGLFLWEAFVSGRAKGRAHCDDAQAGVVAFQRSLPMPRSCLRTGPDSYSLIGAALLRSGWSKDLSLLGQTCVVVRAADASILKES